MVNGSGLSNKIGSNILSHPNPSITVKTYDPALKLNISAVISPFDHRYE